MSELIFNDTRDTEGGTIDLYIHYKIKEHNLW